MEHISNVTELSDTDVEALFRGRAQEALSAMSIPGFSGDGLALARSEEEIAKCVELAERSEHKRMLRSRLGDGGSACVEGKKRKAERESGYRRRGLKTRDERGTKHWPHARGIKGRGKK